MPTQYNFPPLIQNQTDLDQLCDHLSAYDQVAVDTEFVRTNTYAPHLGLLQLSADGVTVCVDPLQDLSMDQLWQLLFDPARRNILHSAKQDLEVMWFDRNDIIHNLIDTQVCAALLGYPAQIGYAGLLSELLNIDIAKTQTRTDWSRRPLTDAQLHYAAEDVAHLPEMHSILQERLQQLGRYEWAVQDSQALCNIKFYKPDPSAAWQRLKGIPFLPPAEQARARALATWREARAVAADKPRGWILSDKALLQLATANPQHADRLQQIDDLAPAVIRNQGKKLLHILASTNDSFANGEIEIDQFKVDIDREKSLSKKMSTLIREEAEKLGIAAEVLASKRDITALIRGAADTRVTSGWRQEIVGDKLLGIIS